MIGYRNYNTLFLPHSLQNPEKWEGIELQARLTSMLAEQMGLTLENRKANVGAMAVDHRENCPPLIDHHPQLPGSR
jgi:hypothetical protein